MLGIPKPTGEDEREPLARFALRDGLAGSQDRLPELTGTPLSDERTDALLARLPELEAREDMSLADALPTEVVATPRPGESIELVPPPEPAPVPDTDGGELTVERVTPEGEIPAARRVSVVFSRPVFEVGRMTPTDDELRLVPRPAGQWRTVGTRIAAFESDEAFPAATRYELVIGDALKTADGQSVTGQRRFEFATPAVKMVRHHPPTGRPSAAQPVIVIGFDQAIDVDAVFRHCSLIGEGAAWPVRIAREKDLADDEAAKAVFDSLAEDRRLAFVPRSPLQLDTGHRVVLSEGLPSAEGPRVTELSQSFEFKTHGPLKLVSAGCLWGRGECRPGTPWRLKFTNPLDVDGFDPRWLGIEPALPGYTAQVSGDSLTIGGRSRANTRYRIEVSRRLKDVFGQALANEANTFISVGDAEPSLSGPSGLAVLPPGATRLPFSVQGLDAVIVEVSVVSPADWPEYLQWRQARHRKRRPAKPGRNVLNRRIGIANADEWTATHFDLAELFDRHGGQLLVTVDAAELPAGLRRRPSLEAWVQSTELAVDAFLDDDELLAWVTELGTGRPIAGAEVELTGGITGRSDADGLARLRLPGSTSASQTLVARKGDDTVMLPERLWAGPGSWRQQPHRSHLLWHVFDDRGLYRPGESARLKGWVRRVSGQPRARLELVDGSLGWKLMSPRGHELGKGRVKLNEHSGFDIELELPEDADLGSSRLELELGMGQRHVQYLQVQEFKRPEFVVDVAVPSGPQVRGETIEIVAEARSFAGEDVGSLDVSWEITAARGRFQPDDWDDFVFGSGRHHPWLPWWEPPRTPQDHESRTDGRGRHRLELEVESFAEPYPVLVDAEATIIDVDRQARTASGSFTLHPAELAVGVRLARGFIGPGDEAAPELAVVDLEGRAVAGRRVRLVAERRTWVQRGTSYEEEFVDAERCEVTSRTDAVSCKLSLPKGGSWRLRAEVVDDAGRTSRTQTWLYVAGADQPERTENLEQEPVRIVPEKKKLVGGEPARLLVIAPFTPSEGLITLRHGDIVSVERVSLSSLSEAVEVTVPDTLVPGLDIQVDLVGERDGEPAFASGQVDLEMDLGERSLSVTAKSRRSELGPGESTVVEIEVKDSSGRAVSDAEVAVLVVDEAILSLTGKTWDDPATTFFPKPRNHVRDHQLRSFVLKLDDDAADALDEDALDKEALGSLGYGGTPMPRKAMRSRAAAPPMAEAAMAMDSGFDAEGGGGGDEPPVEVRSDFRALAAFAPSLRTDRSGKVSLPVELPDTVTEYRVVAVVAGRGEQFGRGESSFATRLPLRLQASFPRFLNLGDELELPFVLVDQSGRDQRLELALRSESLELPEGSAFAVNLPAFGRAELRVPARAAKVGPCLVQALLTSQGAADAVEVTLPVLTPATSEAFAAYGELTGGAVEQTVKLPSNTLPGYGALEINTSSTQLQGLTDALLYLESYPYACSEQLASRVLAIASMRDVLTAFEAEELPPPAALEARVAADLKTLARRQRDDGGFGWWGDDEGDSSPTVTLHCVHAAQAAQAAGFAVPEDLLDEAQDYLRDIRRHCRRLEWSQRSIDQVEAHSIALRSLLGDPDVKRAKALLSKPGLEGLSLESAGFLWPTLHEAGEASATRRIRSHLRNHLHEEAATAEFGWTAGQDDPWLLRSGRRSDAILLWAWLAYDPDDELTTKLARGLLAHRKKGRWGSTQENSWVLVALDRYFEIKEGTTPSFTARAWLDEQLVLSTRFDGRDTERRLRRLPLSMLSDDASSSLIVGHEGRGRLYYRIGLRRAPADFELEPVSRGFTVGRSYEAVDHEDDVRQLPDGTWRIKAGARVRVKLDLANPARRYHVALVDPLPAGLEPVGPEPQERPGWWKRGRIAPWWGHWHEHENLRDERAEVFSSLLWPGAHEYSYLTRATTPGRFLAPPARVEEMYADETFARSASTVVVVE